VAFVVDRAPMGPQEATPHALGYRPVAEWARNAACWSAWPASEHAWGGYLADAQREFVSFCNALLAHEDAERMELLVPDAQSEASARAALHAHGARVRYRRLPYGDVWLRDTAPWFVPGPRDLCCVRFGFNGWGEKYTYIGDAELSARLCTERGLRSFAFDAILEGGALELDGEGTCLTTESCVLNQNRGQERKRDAIEALLRDALAVNKVLWLRAGLLGDHTDGHIDNLARFVAPGVVMHMRALCADDPNRETLATIERDLGRFTDASGRALRLLPVPSPGRVLDAVGAPIAASYMNFYVGNRVVIVPAFGSAYDEPAREAIAAAFPDRRVVLSLARAILEGGGGTFHCMTRQEPELVE
jgi:agmatine deiminase